MHKCRSTWSRLPSILLVTLLILANLDCCLFGIIKANTSKNDPFRRKYHELTFAEVEALKEKIGTRKEGENYNIVIDGHGTGLAPPTEEEWNSMIGTVFVESEGERVQASGSKRLDLEPYFPPVGNQLGQGSCCAWSTGYYTNGYLQARIHGWTDVNTGSNASRLMSPAWVYNKVNFGVDGGSWFSDCMDLVSSVGAASLYTMPYDDEDYVSWGSEDAWREAPLYRTLTYEVCNASDIEVIKSWIDQGYTVCFAIYASFMGYYYGLFGGDYVLSYAEYPGISYNHANTIVGYDDSVSDDGDVGAFRVVNSWGNSWGDGGFYWITYHAMDKIQAACPLAFRYVPRNPDLLPYTPTILAVWSLDPAGDRGASIELGIGSSYLPLDVRYPLWDGSSMQIHDFPEFMCLDISEFKDEFDLGTHKFYLKIGAASTSSVVTSFRVEFYEQMYVPGGWDSRSDESPDVPAATPTTVSSNFLPIAQFNYSPENPDIIDVIRFTDTSSDFDGEIQSWTWNFGDDTTSMEQNPSHKYLRAGNYTVTLTVVDDDLTQSLALKHVNVLAICFTQIQGATLSSPALVNGSEELYMVVRGTNNGIYYRATVGGEWTGNWVAIAGATSDVPAIAILDGILHLVVRGTDNGIYHKYMNLTTGTWSGWAYLRGATPSSPVLATSPGTLHLVVRGTNNGIYYKYWTTSGGWSDSWLCIPGATNDVPAITVLGNNLHLVVRGTDNGIYHNVMDLNSRSWTGWNSISGATSSSPSIVASGSNQLDIVVRGMSNGIYHKSWSSTSSWSAAWEVIPGATNDRPTLAKVGNILYLVVRGTDNGIYVKTMDLSSGVWSGWTNIPGATASYPVLVARYQIMNMAIRGVENSIYYTHWNCP